MAKRDAVIAIDFSTTLPSASNPDHSLTTWRSASPTLLPRDHQEALDFAVTGKGKAIVATERPANINHTFGGIHAADVDGRIVIDFQNEDMS